MNLFIEFLIFKYLLNLKVQNDQKKTIKYSQKQTVLYHLNLLIPEKKKLLFC